MKPPPMPRLTNRLMREVHARSVPDDDEPFDPEAFMERSAVAFMEVMIENGADEEALLGANLDGPTPASVEDLASRDPHLVELATAGAKRLQRIARRRKRAKGVS